MGKQPLRTTADDFSVQKDDSYRIAWAALTQGCEIPPSLEVFQYSLERARSRARTPISVVQHARLIADTYQRQDCL